MAFELKHVVPWGRNFTEYTHMFQLSSEDLENKILSVGDGPAGFNAEMAERGKKVVSLDPLYSYQISEIKVRISETKAVVAEQIQNNYEHFLWHDFKTVENLVKARCEAMSKFLTDYERGKNEERYIAHEMPNRTSFNELTFKLGISSHFLLLYSDLGLSFHISAIKEMLRISEEVRIFPIVNLESKKTDLLWSVISFFEKDFDLTIEKTEYEFQKNANEMLRIKRK